MKKTTLIFIAFIVSTSIFAQEWSHNIVGYFVSWGIYGRNYHVTDIPSDKINVINYAFANIVNGEIALGDAYADIDKFYPGDSWDPDSLRGSFHQLQLLKANAPHVKTLISVGGWTWSTYFSDVALTEESRATFAASCVEFIQEYGFDGVDLDWEYPVSGGLPGNVHRPEDKQNFTLLLAELRTQLDAAGDYWLTIAAPASAMKMANMEVDSMHIYLDWINLMTYDYHGAWGGEGDAVTHFNAPLYMTPDDPLIEPYHSEFNIATTVANYLAEGVPATKLHLGFPFYGRGYAQVANSNNGLFADYTGPCPGTWENGNLDFWDINNNYIGINGYLDFWDENAHAAWVYNPNTQIMINYDTPQSIQDKADFLQMHNLGGAMFWEFSGDKNEVLLTALNNALPDTSITATTPVFTEKQTSFALQNYPNPFNPETMIRFVLPYSAEAEMSIFNVKGQKICTLFQETKAAGEHNIRWNGRNSESAPVSSGIYWCILKLNNRLAATSKLLLLK